ncbi:amidohydrolase family protein [Paralcaligenes ginsengisoli]
MKHFVFEPLAPEFEEQSIAGGNHSQPKFSVPSNACDCHVHIFGPRERYPLADDRTFAPGIASVDDVLAMHDRLGVSRMVIVQASPQGTDNSCVIDSLKQLEALGRQARAVAVVASEAGRSVLDELHAAGVRGLRVNLQSYGQTNPGVAAERITAAAALAAPMGWHIQTYTTLALIAQIKDTIGKLPVPLVVDHFGLVDPAAGLGQPGFATLITLVRQGKVYVKLSAPYRIIERADGRDLESIARTLIDANLGQMLWGTDWPHTGPWPGVPRDRDGAEPFHPVNDGAQFDIFGNWTTPQERQQILVHNPAKLYDF